MRIVAQTLRNRLVFGKSVADDVYSMTFEIRVCLQFGKCLYKKEAIYLRKKILWLNQEKLYSAVIFSALTVIHVFFSPSHFMGLVY